MNPIIKTLIVSKTKKSFELDELNNLKFIGNYETDELILIANGKLKNGEPISRSSEKMLLSKNEDKISIFKNDVLSNFNCDKIISFNICIDFKNENVINEIKFIKNGEKLKTVVNSKL